jgi:hypothetical protein
LCDGTPAIGAEYVVEHYVLGGYGYVGFQFRPPITIFWILKRKQVRLAPPDAVGNGAKMVR